MILDVYIMIFFAENDDEVSDVSQSSTPVTYRKKQHIYSDESDEESAGKL